MSRSPRISRLPAIAVSALLLLTGAHTAFAHCDTLDGPVVAAARQALDQNNPNLVLIWVKRENEPEIKAAFNKAVSVRKLNSAAKDMADRYFFETLVRVHRAGEGAPFTGLKSAGADLGPAVPAADKAITTGDVGPVARLLTITLQAGLKEQFARVEAHKNYDKNNVTAGREYVEAYVEYVHYVEGMYDAAKAEAHGHYEEYAAAGAPAATACKAE
jgi:uncharacterized protein DUF6448